MPELSDLLPLAFVAALTVVLGYASFRFFSPARPTKGKGAKATAAEPSQASLVGASHPDDANLAAPPAKAPPRQHPSKQEKAGATTPTHPRHIITLKGFTEAVTGCAFSQDGKLIAATSEDRTIRVFPGIDAGSSRPNPLRANLPLDDATCVSLSANGKNVLCATRGARNVLAYSVTLQSSGGGAKAGLLHKRTLPSQGACHRKPMVACLLANSGAFVLTVGGEDDAQIKVWSLSGDELCSFTNKQATAPTATPILQPHPRPRARARPARSPAPPTLPTAPSQGEQYGAALSADSRFVAIASWMSDAKLIEVETDKSGAPTALRHVMTLSAHRRAVCGVSFADDCAHAAICSRDGTWSVWKYGGIRYAQGEDPKRVALSPHASILCASAGASIHLLDVQSGSLIETIGAAHPGGGISALSFASDGTKVASAAADGRVRVWRAADAGKAGTV